jgi:hypothetical protein
MDLNRPPLMDDARRRHAGHDAAPAPRRPGPIAGPPKPFELSPYAYGGAFAVALVAALIFLPGLLTPAARPALDPTAPTIAPSIHPAAPAASGAQGEALNPGPLAVLTSDAVAYDAPGGAQLGPVGGRAVLAYIERQDVRWMRVELGEGTGAVWVAMGALAGNAVDLSVIPCGTTCVAGPMTQPTAVYVAPVAPAPVYVAPTERPVVVATLTAPAAEVQVISPTDGPAPLPPTPCPIVMTQCQAPLVEVRP